MIALQLMNDVGQYPIMWHDDNTNMPPTLFELDAMIDASFDLGDEMDEPIGSYDESDGSTVQSFWVAPTKDAPPTRPFR